MGKNSSAPKQIIRMKKYPQRSKGGYSRRLANRAGGEIEVRSKSRTEFAQLVMDLALEAGARHSPQPALQRPLPIHRTGHRTCLFTITETRKRGCYEPMKPDWT